MNKHLLALLGLFLSLPATSHAQDPAILGDNSRQAPNARRIWDRPNYSRTYGWHGERFYYQPAYDPGHWVAHDTDPSYFGYFVNGIQVAGYDRAKDEYRTYDANLDRWSRPMPPPWRR